MAINSMPIFSVFLLLISVWCFVADSQGGDSLPCIKKLIPCQPYLKGNSAPAPLCCLPLNQMVADDRQCLCAVFNNTAILSSFNVTQSDALNLAKTCRANADISLCVKAAAPSSIPSTPSTSANNSTASEPAQKKSAATTVGGSMGLVVVLINLIVSVF